MSRTQIAVAGLGYVGLSNAVLLAQHNEVVAIDIVPERVAMLNNRQSPIEDADIEDFLLNRSISFRATLDKQIAHFEETLQQPLESRASVGISGEIRKFVKDMTTEERHKFIQEAIDAGDHTTVSAVLGAPSYLSGLDANFAKTYTRFWHERATPEVATKLKAVRNAKAAIEERGALLFKEVEKAMGSTWGKVQELRQGNDKALAALKFGE